MKLIGKIKFSPAAKICFLKEALLWVAFNKLPLAFRSFEEEEMDARFDRETYEDLQGFLDGLVIISNRECAIAGIPPNPRNDPKYEDIGTPENIDDDAAYAREHFPWSEPAEFDELKEWAIEFEKLKPEWDRHYKTAIERAKIALFPELSDGKIRLLGRRFDKATYGRFEDIDFDEVDEYDVPYRLISPSDIRLEKTDLEDCILETDVHFFTHIKLPVANLISAFPPKAFEEPKSGTVYGDELFVTDQSARDLELVLKPQSRRGRKRKYPRKPFIDEALRRLSEMFPDGFDAAVLHREQLIDDLLTWFQNDEGHEEVERTWGQARLNDAIAEFVRLRGSANAR